MEEIGSMIKYFRMKEELTLKQMSSQTGLSTSRARGVFYSDYFFE